MYYVQDAHSFWDWIYFVLLIVVSAKTNRQSDRQTNRMKKGRKIDKEKKIVLIVKR